MFSFKEARARQTGDKTRPSASMGDSLCLFDFELRLVVVELALVVLVCDRKRRLVDNLLALT